MYYVSVRNTRVYDHHSTSTTCSRNSLATLTPVKTVAIDAVSRTVHARGCPEFVFRCAHVVVNIWPVKIRSRSMTRVIGVTFTGNFPKNFKHELVAKVTEWRRFVTANMWKTRTKSRVDSIKINFESPQWIIIIMGLYIKQMTSRDLAPPNLI